jgi:F0F1-type ATP synthase assembly protein I
VASGVFFLASCGVAVLVKRFRRENLSDAAIYSLLFGEPFVTLSFLAIVLWVFAASLMGAQVELLTLPFSAFAKAAAIALGLYLLLCAA